MRLLPARPTSSSTRPGLRARGLPAFGLVACVLAGSPALRAQDAAPAPPPAASAASAPEAEPPVVNSSMDGALMYQLLMAEFARQQERPADAVELMLDAGRHTKDDALFRRAIEIAMEAESPDKALAITRSWRQAMPRSTEAVRTQLQFLFAMDRVSEVGEPLRTLLALSSGPDRASLIAGLPRMAQRAKDKAGAAAQFQAVITPWLDKPETRTAARVALGRMRLNEGQPAAALEQARLAGARDPAAVGVPLLALDLINRDPSLQAGKDGAEALIVRYLATPGAEPLIRQAYASLLATQKRGAEALVQMRQVADQRPQQITPWLSLAELQLQAQQPAPAEQSLQHVLALIDGGTAAPEVGVPDDADSVRQRRIQTLQLLAYAAEQRADYAAQGRWLDQIPADANDRSIVSARAGLLARQGKMPAALALVRALPGDSAEARRDRTLIEVQLHRQQNDLDAAFRTLSAAAAKDPDDLDLVYEQAMVAEQLKRPDDMERLLRQILQHDPDNTQALNALGYSLADRSLRLDEALALVARAHQLAPTDPFIVDSLGWVEFRRGNLDQAAHWLRQAYAARNDVEIAAHLGETLWMQGQRDEALRIWREARSRDASNEVLQSTIKRLGAAL